MIRTQSGHVARGWILPAVAGTALLIDLPPAAANGYRPSTIQKYLNTHPAPDTDVVHVEDGPGSMPPATEGTPSSSTGCGPPPATPATPTTTPSAPGTISSAAWGGDRSPLTGYRPVGFEGNDPHYSDFYIWTHVYDVSGVNGVTLYVRADAFDLVQTGGSVATLDQDGFGNSGQLYLNAAGPGDLVRLTVAGVFASNGTAGDDRYLSGNIVGAGMAASGMDGNNVGLNNMSLEPLAICLDAIDTDQDLLPDYFERIHFGNLTAESAGGNGDGDKFNHQQEYWLGTQPTNGASALMMIMTGEQTGLQTRVTWQRVGGKTYAVESADDLALEFVNVGRWRKPISPPGWKAKRKSSTPAPGAPPPLPHPPGGSLTPFTGPPVSADAWIAAVDHLPGRVTSLRRPRCFPPS